MGNNDWERYVEQWNGRIRGGLLDLAILYLAAFSAEKPHAYSIHKQLERKWKNAPPLPTIYSTISRLQENGMVRIVSEIENNRVRKVIHPTEAGWKAMEIMRKNLEEVVATFTNNFQGGIENE